MGKFGNVFRLVFKWLMLSNGSTNFFLCGSISHIFDETDTYARFGFSYTAARHYIGHNDMRMVRSYHACVLMIIMRLYARGK